MVAQQTDSPLIDECLAQARQMVGMELDRTLRQKNLEASRSAIRRYAYGIGDDNPLWCNEQYAAKSRYGCIVAPPTFIFSVDDTAISEPRLPGLGLLHAQDEIEFFKPILVNDQTRSTCRIVHAEEKRGTRVPRMVLLVGEILYINEDQEAYARLLATKLRVPGSDREGGLRYGERPAYEYSEAEMEAIRQGVMEEERRGALPRYWESVQVGDLIRPVVKGPLSLRDMICYYAGNGVAPEIYRAHELAYRGSRLEDPKHVEPSLAHKVGMPGAYDIGHQRVGWVSHMLTNWMGDDGSLKRLKLRISRPNVFGDTTWCRARVTAKRAVEHEHLVDCEVWTENQLGEVTGTGEATVVLPSSGKEVASKGSGT